MDACALQARGRCRHPGHGGCLRAARLPPLETVVAFWSADETRHQFKLFKPVTEVVLDDLRPTWMKPALIAIEGAGFECC